MTKNEIAIRWIVAIMVPLILAGAYFTWIVNH